MGFFNRFIRLFAVSMTLMIPLRVLSESVDSLKTKQVITINKVKEIKTMKIVYWSDYACPYCYIGETRLKKAIKELGLENEVEIETRAFELDPDAPKTVETITVDRFAKKYRLSKEEAQQQIDHISQLGIDEGIDFRYATTLYTNTRDAHRLTKLAQTKHDTALEDRVSELLFDAYFTRNEKLAEHDVLLRVAREAGLGETEAKNVLESNQFEEEVRFDEREAMMRGVHGVPYFMFNGKFVIPGALSVSAFKHTLEKHSKTSKRIQLARMPISVGRRVAVYDTSDCCQGCVRRQLLFLH